VLFRLKVITIKNTLNKNNVKNQQLTINYVLTQLILKITIKIVQTKSHFKSLTQHTYETFDLIR
jgi:hypothetical protein